MISCKTQNHMEILLQNKGSMTTFITTSETSFPEALTIYSKSQIRKDDFLVRANHQ